MMKVIEVFEKRFPGGWKNIRSLHLKTEKSMAIPLYLSEGKTETIFAMSLSLNMAICRIFSGGGGEGMGKTLKYLNF